jgi:ABC-type multidrug transport system ATPase subunit
MLLDLLKEESEEQGVTVLFSTHIFDRLNKWGTHLTHVSDGQVLINQKLADIGRTKHVFVVHTNTGYGKNEYAFTVDTSIGYKQGENAFNVSSQISFQISCFPHNCCMPKFSCALCSVSLYHQHSYTAQWNEHYPAIVACPSFLLLCIQCPYTIKAAIPLNGMSITLQ